MGFKERTTKSTELKHDVLEYLKRHGVEYADAGYETREQSPKFKCVLQKLNDLTSMQIRYFPDLIVSNKKTWLMDIKNSMFIEKNAFDVYKALHLAGFNVCILSKEHDKLVFIDFPNLRIKPLTTQNLPIRDGWVYPRELSRRDYLIWKAQHPNASGTPFAVIDLVNSKKLYLG